MEGILLELDDIKKDFGETKVLKGVSLKIHKGEFVTLLGASGCGKTTTLRIIAGLEAPDHGRVLLGGEDITGLEPNKRNINTVFQNYALFPHMTVFQNIAYGLKIRKVDKKEISERVRKMLSLVQLDGYDKRYPSELSGGQMQRVAIARAVINNPEILLLDEPLGALDLQLRRQMQLELKKLQKQLGITFIYITHDQEEAINMSDRIVVMREGILEQTGTPSEVYDHPLTSYVAEFVGSANILHGKYLGGSGNLADLAVCGGIVRVLSEEGLTPAERVTVAVRSENVRIMPKGQTGIPSAGQTGIPAVVKEKSFNGGMLRIVLELDGKKEIVSSQHGISAEVSEGEPVSVDWLPEHGVLVDRVL